VLDALIRYAASGERLATTLGESLDTAYFQRFGRLLKLFRSMTSRELENRTLPAEAIRLLSMVVESKLGDGGTSASPSFTGWYFDLFASPDEALEPAAFLADFHNSTELSEASYAGVQGVVLGVFLVDTAGEPRVVVGPVTDAFAAREKLPRLGDEMLEKAHRESPWARSYTAVPLAAPPLALDAKRTSKPGFSPSITIEATSTRALGKVTVELLDHHRRSLGAQTLVVGTSPVEFKFPGRPLKGSPKGTPEPVQGLHVRVGEWHAWDTGELTLLFGNAPVFAGDRVGRAWGGMALAPATGK
jgi:hypothetical protein